MSNEKVVTYFQGDTMAADVWADKYAMKDKGVMKEETPTDMHLRLAKEFARVEHRYKKTEESNRKGELGKLSDFGYKLFTKRKKQSEADITQEFFDYFDKFGKIVPQGSIMTNLGNKYIFGSLSNCFGIAPPYDSYGGIMRTDEELVQLMKRRGGVGTNLNNLRYYSAWTSNAAKSSTGVPSFSERFSNSTREVAQEGRRGALMLLLSCKHPDIFRFVKMKDDKTKVTGANVTTMFTDEFMQAVLADADFLCRFPVTFDEADLIAWEQYEYNVINTETNSHTGEQVSLMKIKATELFNLVSEMAWKNAEPGVAFIDRIQDYSPDGVYELYKPILCNPCGEQWFSADETCRLIAENFMAFVNNPFSDTATINLEQVYEISYMQQRLGDNLVDLEVEYIDRIIDKILSDPEPYDIKSVELNLWGRIKVKAQEGRRTGNGFTGLGDMLASLGLAYDSEHARDIVDLVMHTKMEAELDATIDMAILRGTFTGWDRDKEYSFDRPNDYLKIAKGNNSFFQMLGEEFPTQSRRMYEYGRRNVSWSTVAPTGTVSLMTQTTSGLEPLFKAFYIRRKKINATIEGVRIDFVDQNGDNWQEYAVLHPKFRDWIVSNQLLNVKDIPNLTSQDIKNYFEKSPWYKSEADDISFEGRVSMNAIIQKYTSNAISCTINLPEDVPVETIRGIYMKAWEKGLKGVTVYRDGSRSGVLITESAKTTKDKFGYNDAIDRPQVLEADYYYTTSKGKPYAVLIGLLDGLPYELFAIENPTVKRELTGTIEKVKSGVYKFVSEGYTIDNLVLRESGDERVTTRWVSLALRTGANPKKIADQVEKSEVTITSFTKVVSRILKRYIPDEKLEGELCPECQQPTVIREEGCKKCTNCGNSKC